MQNSWTREEEIIVFNLYCKIPFQRSSKNHPDVIKIAKLIGRSPSAVNMKIGNFGSFDENLKIQGIKGLTNTSKLDRQIWEEFNEHWDQLAYESEKLIAAYEQQDTTLLDEEFTKIPIGKEKSITAKQRINHNFFRKAIMASYNDTCCITGINIPTLVIASHIKPWKNSTETEKTNPSNGLCLNSLHDKAFDQGFITIKPDYTIIISSAITDTLDEENAMKFFLQYKGQKIHMPDKFIPKKEFLEYHNDVIFERWK